MQSHLIRSLRFIVPLLLLTSLAVSAKTTMCPVFGNHMVLQRGKPIPVWGWDTAGQGVTVTLGTDVVTAVTDSTGYWHVAMPTRIASSTPITMTVKGSATLTYTDVLIGDVWLAGGQSNMDYAFWWGDGILDWANQMAIANHPTIRDFKVTTISTATPQTTFQGGWHVCTPKIAGSPQFSSGIEFFSCTAYFFALKVSSMGIPVGMVDSSDGGTQIESWLSPASVTAMEAKFPDIVTRWNSEQAKEAPSAIPGSVVRPGGLFNAMINPLLQYSFKGIIWYQGENNVTRAQEYQSLFPSLITGWRASLNQGTLPFYWCQLSNYNYTGANGTNWAYLREAQNMTLSVPSTGQSINFDIGNAGNVHLEDKEDVGRRLGAVALWNTYGCRNVPCQGPTLDHVVLTGSTYQVFFKNAVGGLVQMPVPSWQVPSKAPIPISQLGGFQIAGANKVFYSAVAQFDATHSSVLVSSPSVPSPLALRYGFVNNPVNLQIGNTSNLPAEQFRTDNWPENPAEVDPTTITK